MTPLKIKICGMKEPANIDAVASLNPDMLGFIFYAQSPRNATDTLSPVQLLHLDHAIEKTGVFVNEELAKIKEHVEKYQLSAIQLSGDEDRTYVESLKSTFRGVKLLKGFHLDKDFDFGACKEFEPVCDLFLFDTKSSLYGGSGEMFPWEILSRYQGSVPFLLSGGIGRENVAAAIAAVKGHSMGLGLDLNSKIEIKPGVKSVSLVEEIIRLVRA